MKAIHIAALFIFAGVAAYAACNQRYLYGSSTYNETCTGADTGEQCVWMQFVETCTICRDGGSTYSHCVETSQISVPGQWYQGTCQNGICVGGTPIGDPVNFTCAGSADQECP
jgi:hypothetical protein